MLIHDNTRQDNLHHTSRCGCLFRIVESINSSAQIGAYVYNDSHHLMWFCVHSKYEPSFSSDACTSVRGAICDCVYVRVPMCINFSIDLWKLSANETKTVRMSVDVVVVVAIDVAIGGHTATAAETPSNGC